MHWNDRRRYGRKLKMYLRLEKLVWKYKGITNGSLPSEGGRGGDGREVRAVTTP